LGVLNPEQTFRSLGMGMVDLYSLTAPTTARKEAATRMAGKAYEKRKTRAAQVIATREQGAADAEVLASPRTRRRVWSLRRRPWGVIKLKFRKHSWR
jgi:hypothetical protein